MARLCLFDGREGAREVETVKFSGECGGIPVKVCCSGLGQGKN